LTLTTFKIDAVTFGVFTIDAVIAPMLEVKLPDTILTLMVLTILDVVVNEFKIDAVTL